MSGGLLTGNHIRYYVLDEKTGEPIAGYIKFYNKDGVAIPSRVHATDPEPNVESTNVFVDLIGAYQSQIEWLKKQNTEIVTKNNEKIERIQKQIEFEKMPSPV